MEGAMGYTAIIGGLVLAIALLFVMLRNKRRTPEEKRRTEEATRDLYARETRDRKRDEAGR